MTIKDEELKQTVELYKKYGSQAAAADAAGIPRTTFFHRLQKATVKGFLTVEAPTKAYERVTVPEDDIPVEDIVEQLHTRFKKRKEHVDAKEWQHIHMKANKPIGLLWMGDPHIDDNFCDWDSLKRDLSIIQDNENIHGCGLGDYQNNWVGRLARLYAEQDTSHATAWKLVEWLIKEMDPMILIGGNHDMWSGNGDPLKWMVQPHSLHEDWVAQIKIHFPNKKVCKIHAAHDHPGHSQWNILHGQTKAAMFKSNAHLYIAGHRHTWALAQIEMTQQKETCWLARARGYKFHDTYAVVKGYEEQQYGQSILQIINPNASRPTGFVQCFSDVEAGADYLAWLTAKASA